MRAKGRENLGAAKGGVEGANVTPRKKITRVARSFWGARNAGLEEESKSFRKID